MRRFNTALAKAHARYPALRVFDWSDVALDDWFAGDGIHYTAAGYAYFAALIAAAVAEPSRPTRLIARAPGPQCTGGSGGPAVRCRRPGGSCRSSGGCRST